MRKIDCALLLAGVLVLSAGTPQKYPYRDSTLPVEKRVEDLLDRMSVEEKVAQISAQLLYADEFATDRNYKLGHIRNRGHFMANATPRAVAQAINGDTKQSMEANRWGIPVLQHGEALHGAQWGNATCFPQSIAMGATFDEDLYFRVGQVVAQELRAVGVRQVYAPVINITRDQRWGRGQESYGEDVLLNSRMGVAYVKALEEGGIVSTPKHFVDNYGEGGHDSFASITSWRELREVYLEPFRACVEEGGARSIMSSYNSVDGIPSSCNPVLLQDILKDEWGFKGYVVSDYDAVGIVQRHHLLAATEEDALALCLNNGLDLQLHKTHPGLLEKVKDGSIPMKVLDEAVRRVLTVKFELGLFDEPFVDSKKADAIVRSAEHRELAYESACKAMTLLKNSGVLPLREGLRIGVLGPAADTLNLGDYSGGYAGWHGDGAITPFEGLKKAYKGDVLLDPDPALCDVLLFFPSITEEEGKDRSSFRLPSARMDQEKMLRELVSTGKPVVVVLHNGAVIDISDWVDKVDAVLEAWYPGEQGGRAVADVLTGAVNPGGRLPFSWVRSIGQNPYYYSIKPSGRGYGYVENDGSPLYPFGYGLSYTTFEYSDFQLPSQLKAGENLKVKVTVTNTGSVAGDEVVQLYAHDELSSVVRPLKQLVAFRRVTLGPGESRVVELEVPYRRFALWDAKMLERVEEGWFEIWLGRDANERVTEGRVYVRANQEPQGIPVVLTEGHEPITAGEWGYNPICPMGVYMADPSAKVLNGKMYVACSLDLVPEVWCSPYHHMLSTEDALHWTLHPNVFASGGPEDKVPYAQADLYAPDIVGKDGKYYLYYDMSDWTEGVAEADSPVGPFQDGEPIEGIRGIDPCVFIDDDGQAYYFWDQFSAKGAKLNPDMKTLDMSTLHDGLVTEDEHYFHEGSFVFKRNGWYYYVYADVSRQNMPTCIGYSMSRNVFGPYEYKGVIVDSNGCDPDVWNNHGSVVELNGQWYVLYHRSTHHSSKYRKACIEPITFNEDGTINEVEMTSQGAGKPIPATRTIDAARACLFNGGPHIRLLTPDREILSGLLDGSKAAWKYVDFPEGITKLTMRVKALAGGTITVRQDQSFSGEIASLEVPAGKGEWLTLECEVHDVETGPQALWMGFSGDWGSWKHPIELFELDWFRFE